MAPVLHAEPPVKPSSLEGAETPAATRAWGDVPAAGEGDVASCISCRVMQRELQCRSSAGAAGPYGFATGRGSSGRHSTARRRRNWKKSCRTRVDVIALLADPIVLRSCRSKWVQFDHVKPSILHALALHALGVQDLRPVKFYKAMCSGSIVRWCTVCPRDLSSTMKRWHSSQCQVPTSWRCWRQRLPAWQKAGLELLYLDREREVSELFWVEKWWRTASAYVYFQARYRERCVAPQSV